MKKRILGVMLTLCMLLSVLPLTPVVSAATETNDTQGVISVIHDEPFYSGFNEFDFTVNGRASKLRIVNADGETYTVSRNSTLSTGADVQGLVAIKSYDAEGNEVSNGSADIDYERWKINLNLAEGEYTAEAKYGEDWYDVAKNFTVNYNFGAEVVSVKINGTANGGFNKYAVEICGSASKVQVVFANGSTYTFDRTSTMSGSDSSKGVVSIKAYDKDDNEVALGSDNTASELWVINMSLKEGTYTVKAKHKNAWETDGQTLTVVYPTEALDEVKVTKVESKDGSYCFNVNGTAQKLQLVYSDGQTTTLTKGSSSVSVKYFNSANAEVDQNSGEIAYEIWTLNKKLKDGEYTAIAKYHNGTTYVWGTTALEFTVELGKLTSSIDGDKINALSAFTYEKNIDGKVKITGVKDTSVTELTVPDFVYEIAFGAFKDCTSLQKLTVPYVGNRSNGEYGSIGYVFGTKSYKNNLKYMPKALTHLTVTGGYSNNETLQSNAFYFCRYLTDVVIGDGVTVMENGIFYDNFALTNLTVPFAGGSKKTYPDGYMYPLHWLFYPSTSDSAGNNMYRASAEYHQRISPWNTSNAIKTLSGYIPYALKQITVNGGSIPDSCFYAFKYVEKIVLNDGVDYIGAVAISRCTALTELIIPDSVTRVSYYISKSAQCPAFATMEEKAKNGDGYLYIGKALYKYYGTDEDLVIKDGTVSICSSFLSDNTNISNIKTVKCPESLRYIGCEDGYDGYCLFEECTNLTKVELNEGLEFIHDFAFVNCTALSDIDFPDSINYVGLGAFYDTAWYNNLPDGDVYIGKVYYKYKGEMTEDTTVTIKDGTHCISGGAFSNGASYTATHAYDKLVAVNIPDSVEWIADGAFAECIGLKSVNLPKNLTRLGEQAFFNCTSLEGTVVVPSGVNMLSRRVFYGTNISELRFAEGSKLKYLTEYSIPSGCTTYLPSSVERFYRVCESGTIIMLPADANLVLELTYWYGNELSSYASIYYMGSITDYYKYGNCVAYYSEERPEENISGNYVGPYTGSTDSSCNYWHYDENGKPVLWGNEEVEIQPVSPVYEVLSSTPGSSDSEEAENLFDSLSRTKWCVSFDSENGAYVTFSIGQEAILEKYSFSTANDNDDYPGRNPKSWTIYGSNDENCADASYEGWTEICSVTDDETMQDVVYTKYIFSVDDNTTAYQYYKIVFTANGGNDLLQLSEITLSYTLS